MELSCKEGVWEPVCNRLDTTCELSLGQPAPQSCAVSELPVQLPQSTTTGTMTRILPRNRDMVKPREQDPRGFLVCRMSLTCALKAPLCPQLWTCWGMGTALGGPSKVTPTPIPCWPQTGGAEQGRRGGLPPVGVSGAFPSSPAASAKAPSALGPSPGSCVQL